MRKTAAEPRPAASADLRIAAIDVGSNSIHMVIAQVDPDGAVTTLWRLKEMVGLGRISFPARRLSADAMDRAVLTLGRFQQEAQRRGVEQVIAVATSAVREAENGGDFIERVRLELGLPVRVVAAKEEARLIYLGVRHATDLHKGLAAAFPVPAPQAPKKSAKKASKKAARKADKLSARQAGGPAAALTVPPAPPGGDADGRVLIVDVGGGSVEFIVADANKPLMLESCKLGAARVTARFIKSDPPAPDELRALLHHYDKELAGVCQTILTLRPALALGTSGTLENIAAMCAAVEKPADREARDAVPARPANPGIAGWIEAAPLARLAQILGESRAADRAALPGLDDKRQDQIVAGAVLVNELFRRLALPRMALCRAAMREGMLVDYISRHLPDLAIRRDVPDPRRRSVLDLGRRCDWRQQHSEHVTALVLHLFDALRPLHELGPRERELIEFGSLLHDIGWHVGASGHHKHGMYLILHGGLKGFTPPEVQVIANVARYHRKSAPKPEHEGFYGLPAKAQRVVLVGAALLRVADGLDRSHCGVVQRVTVKPSPGKVRVVLHARGDVELELWAARRKTDLFAQVFGREVVLERAK